jgi:hypothetical protein
MSLRKKIGMAAGGLVVILLWVAAYFVLQSIGYDQGHAIGYSEGHTKGYPEGYNAGQTEGYDSGHAKGYDTGYAGGYDAGYKELSQTGKIYRNPTYQEMKDFLKRDTTNSHRYEGTAPGAYDCENFASDVCNNAEAEGIRAAVVFLDYENTNLGHAIVAFETTDKGLIFIEPQSDGEVMIAVGIGYGYPAKIIKRFIVIW